MENKSQLRRDVNALRGLFEAKPHPMDMATISLHGGEGLYPAVVEMSQSGELIPVEIHGRTLYLPTEKLKKHRPTQ